MGKLDAPPSLSPPCRRCTKALDLPGQWEDHANSRCFRPRRDRLVFNARPKMEKAPKIEELMRKKNRNNRGTCESKKTKQWNTRDVHKTETAAGYKTNSLTGSSTRDSYKKEGWIKYVSVWGGRKNLGDRRRPRGGNYTQVKHVGWLAQVWKIGAIRVKKKTTQT